MANPLFLYRNRWDAATLSGGTWVASLPLANTQDRKLSKKARTASVTLASTQMAADLGAEYQTRVVSLHKHNLSLAANVRVRAWQANTFARADTATYVNEDGVVTAAASGERRDWHYTTANDSVTYRTTLLERAYTNLVTSDDISAWSDVNTTTVTASVTDPAGGTGAYTITGGGDATEARARQVTFTGGAVKTVAWVIRERTMPALGVQQLQLRQTTGASADRILFTITGWVAGKPTVAVTTGTLLGVHYVGNGYWRVRGQSTAVTAAETHFVYVYSNVSASAGAIDVYRVNVYNNAIPPMSILSASEVTTADDMTIALKLTTPQAATYYYEGIVGDLPNQGTARHLYRLGNATGNDAHLAIYWAASSASLIINFANGSAFVFGAWTVSTIALGDRIRVRITQASTGAITAGLTINEGTEDTTLDSAFGSTLALPTAWANNVVALAGTNVSGNHGLIAFKAARGSYTTAQMAAMTGAEADIAYYEPYDSEWTTAYPEIYPAGILEPGEDGYATSKITAAELAAGYQQDFIHVLPATVGARYWTIELDDTANTAGYLEIGRVWHDYGYQPTYNMVTGSGLGYSTTSSATETDGGAFVFLERIKRRVFDFAFEHFSEDEALVRFLELNRYLGVTGQLLFIADPDDTYHLHRRSFIGVLSDLSPLTNKIAAYYDQSFRITEEIG